MRVCVCVCVWCIKLLYAKELFVIERSHDQMPSAIDKSAKWFLNAYSIKFLDYHLFHIPHKYMTFMNALSFSNDAFNNLLPLNAMFWSLIEYLWHGRLGGVHTLSGLILKSLE